jgi:hypothetical protein
LLDDGKRRPARRGGCAMRGNWRGEAPVRAADPI